MKNTDTLITARVTAATLAELLALSERTVRRLAAEGTIPPPTDAGFELGTCVRGYVAALRARKDSRRMADAKLRRALAQAKTAELDLAQREGSLLPVEEIYQRLRPACVAMRQCILASSMMEDERGDLIDHLGNLLCDGLRTPSAAPDALVAADLDTAANESADENEPAIAARLA
jgi:DNA-binding transcriptional MerR regulator